MATSMATAGSGARPEAIVVSIALDKARASCSLSACNFTMDSATAPNCSPAIFKRLASPPAKLDQVSAAEAMRLRAKTSSAGS